jgi:hypothetical protein
MNADSMLLLLPTPDIDPGAAARMARVARRVLDREAQLVSTPRTAFLLRVFASLEVPAVVLAALVYLLWAFSQLLSVLA